MAQVLIVDDSPTELHQLSQMLTRAGHTVITASNGADAVALCRDEQPQVVLMDIVMPGLNGFQATRQLAKDPITAHIPIVIITTKDQETDRAWGIRQGAKEYLTKPIEEQTLISIINRLLEKAVEEA